MSPTITIADLVAFGAEHGVIWHVESMRGKGATLGLHWQADIGAKGKALLDALEARFGVTWPDGRVCVFDSPYARNQGSVRGLVDIGGGVVVSAEVTLFDQAVEKVQVRMVEV